MMILFYERNIDEGGIMTEDRENKIIEERIKGWTAFEYVQHQQHVLLIQLFLCMKNTMNISGI